jgi:hypothetical protein
MSAGEPCAEVRGSSVSREIEALDIEQSYALALHRPRGFGPKLTVLHDCIRSKRRRRLMKNQADVIEAGSGGDIDERARVDVRQRQGFQ